MIVRSPRRSYRGFGEDVPAPSIGPEQTVEYRPDLLAQPDSDSSVAPTILSIIKGILSPSQPIPYRPPVQPVSTMPGWIVPAAVLGVVAVGFVLLSGGRR